MRWRMECDCTDAGCPHVTEGHHGGCVTLYRIDMDDETGSNLCMVCEEDAWNSGLFTDEADEEETD